MRPYNRCNAVKAFTGGRSILRDGGVGRRVLGSGGESTPDLGDRRVHGVGHGEDAVKA